MAQFWIMQTVDLGINDVDGMRANMALGAQGGVVAGDDARFVVAVGIE